MEAREKKVEKQQNEMEETVKQQKTLGEGKAVEEQ